MDLLRLAKLHKAEGLSKEQKQELARKVDVAYCIPNNSFSNQQKNSLAGYNCLHVVAKKLDFNLVRILIGRGADVLKQGTNDGKTPLHIAVDAKTNSQKKMIWEISGKLQDCQIVKTLLCAHVRSNNPLNPKCNSEISHLHIASMFDHAQAVRFFLKNGETLDHVTNADAHWPSYTPLHFAMRYSSVVAAEILLTKGADLSAKDAEGTSPLDILISRLLNVADYINIGQRAVYIPYEEELKRLERIIKTVIGMKSRGGVNFLDNTGLTTFHLSCILSESSIAASFLDDIFDLNVAVMENSKFWPGWTPVHFAASASAETFELLMVSQADITVKNRKGETPLDMCLKRFDPEFVHVVLETKDSFGKILLDTSTSLIELIFVMDDIKTFHAFLGNCNRYDIIVPRSSPILPGYNFLHLALSMNSRTKSWDDFVIETDAQPNVDSLPKVYNCKEDESHLFSERVRTCLTVGCSVDLKNADGLTAIHLAFRNHLNKPHILEELLSNSQEDVVDPNGLSHLHIACAMGNLQAVETLLNVGANIDAVVKESFQWYRRPDSSTMISVNANSTPLHVAVTFEHLDIVKILLDSGADLYAIDLESYTPIHLSIASDEIAKLIISRAQELIEMVSKEGLSHLHVATLVGDAEAMQKLIRYGASVNRSINTVVPDFLSRFAGKTPLQIVTQISGENVAQMLRVLIESGADIYATNTLQCLMGETDFDFSHYLVERLQLKENVKEPLDSSGLTLLHVACSKFDVDWAKQLLSKGADVNARIRNDEEYKGRWKGYTPLHALVARKNVNPNETVKWAAYNLGQFLLNSGADVTIESDDGTPLHIDFCDYIRKVDMQDLPLCLPLRLPQRLLPRSDAQFKNWADELASKMLMSQTAGYANPISRDGFSHFHFFCMADKDYIVTQYLNNGVDVNQATNPFSGKFGGSTALHFAFAFRAFEVANLLIERGADVNAENVDGNTPLHFLNLKDAEDTKRPAVLALKRRGANFDATNLRDETPIDALMTRTHFSLAQFKFLLDNKSSIAIERDDSSLGPAGLIMQNTSANERIEIFKLFIKVFDMRDAMEFGCNPVRDIVKAKNNVTAYTFDDYLKVILEFVQADCEVDAPDEKGLTALHEAITLDNVGAVRALIQLGAEVNASNVDSSIFESGRKPQIEKELALQVHKMQVLRLHVSAASNLIYRQFRDKAAVDGTIEVNIATEVERAMSIEFTKNITARAFLSESWAIVHYSRISPAEREGIDAFFKNVDQLRKQYPVLCGIMLSQYKKAVIRPKLIEIAKEVLTSEREIHLADCLDFVLSYISNDELKYVIKNSGKAKRLLKLFRID